MRTKKYACPNGCHLPPRKKVLMKLPNHTYGFEYNNFNFCPECGSLMPYSLEKVKRFFDIYNIHPLLKNALNLIYKSEFENHDFVNIYCSPWGFNKVLQKPCK